MTRRKAGADTQAPAKDAEAALEARAAWVRNDYPMLRLRLARFAWCAEGVEARARAVVRAWGRKFLEHCAEDARAIEVSPDRYVRALLEFLPSWSMPAILALARRERMFRELVPGLRQADPRFAEHADMVARFVALLSPGTVLDPDRVAMIVRMRPEALEQARARWKARGIAPRKPRLRKVRVAVAPRPRRPLRLGRGVTTLRVLEALRRGEEPAARDIARLAAFAQRGGKAAVQLTRALRAADELPASGNAALLAALPARTRRARVNALRLLAAGRPGAAAELARMSAAAAARAAKLIGLSDRDVREIAAASGVIAADARPPRDGNAVLLDRLVAAARNDAALLGRLLGATSAIGGGKRLRKLAGHVAKLDPERFDAFATAAAALEPR